MCAFVFVYLLRVGVRVALFFLLSLFHRFKNDKRCRRRRRRPRRRLHHSFFVVFHRQQKINKYHRFFLLIAQK